MHRRSSCLHLPAQDERRESAHPADGAQQEHACGQEGLDASKVRPCRRRRRWRRRRRRSLACSTTHRSARWTPQRRRRNPRGSVTDAATVARLAVHRLRAGSATTNLRSCLRPAALVRGFTPRSALGPGPFTVGVRRRRWRARLLHTKHHSSLSEQDLVDKAVVSPRQGASRSSSRRARRPSSKARVLGRRHVREVFLLANKHM